MVYRGDTSDHEGREVLTRERLGETADDLALQVHESGFLPSMIIMIVQGSMAPAGALTYRLGMGPIDAIDVRSYTDIHQILPDPVLLAPTLDAKSTAGGQLLVVDDVANSGRTLPPVVKLLRGFGADVRSAVLYSKPTTTVKPDFCWRHTDCRIVFP